MLFVGYQTYRDITRALIGSVFNSYTRVLSDEFRVLANRFQKKFV